VAVVTFLLAREYRWRNLRTTAAEETRFALALAPDDFDEQSFERFLAVYERRTDAHILAVRDGLWLSSSDFDPADVPGALASVSEEPTLVEAEIEGRSMLVSGAAGPAGVDYYVFFSLQQYHDGLDELARSAVFAWMGMVVLAAGVGSVVARRALRPVASTAMVAEAIAGGDLEARLEAGGNDEFGTLAASFNRMADEVQSSIRRAEAAADRERQFTADIAHELRTPLTGMSGAASLLQRDMAEVPAGLRRPAQLLVDDVARLGRLVTELLELARLDAATDDPERSPLDVDAAVRAVIAGADSRRAAGIRLELEPGLRVFAEPAALRSILANLIDNAIVHGGAAVTVRGSAGADWVVIEVLDRGPGLDTAELGEVFERFHKADRSRSGGGSGLGLAIAREHALRHGGRLTAGQREGGGARFVLELPATDATRTTNVTGRSQPAGSAALTPGDP
jgi:two-component system sensor histidine kinase MtrB